MQKMFSIILSAGAIHLLAVVPAVGGEVTEFWNDSVGWKSSAASFATIDFTGFTNGTVITNQYAAKGIHFSNFVFIQHLQSYPDGAGLFGNNGVRMHFEVPQHAIGMDHLGQTSYFLFYKGNLVAQHAGWFSYGLPGPVYFSGVISDHPFDEVYLFKPQPPFSNNVISLDNLYWGKPQGDLNGDGVVGVFDLLTLLMQWGPCADPDNCPADLNGDGVVNVHDLLILILNWGE